MTDFEKVLIKRDGMSKEDVHDELMNFRSDIFDGDYDIEDIEDELMNNYGLEPDYLMDILGY